jgi:hypothetical protein
MLGVGFMFASLPSLATALLIDVSRLDADRLRSGSRRGSAYFYEGISATAIRVTAEELSPSVPTNSPDEKTNLTAAELAVATEILGSIDTADFEDALHDSLTTADEWTAGSARGSRIHPNAVFVFADAPELVERLQRVYERLNAPSVESSDSTKPMPPLARRLWSASSPPNAKYPFRWDEILYSDSLSPEFRLNMSYLMCGYAAHLGIIVALERGTRLASHVVPCLTQALETAADSLDWLRLQP